MGGLLQAWQRSGLRAGRVYGRPEVEGEQDEGQLQRDSGVLSELKRETSHHDPGPGSTEQDVHPTGLSLPAGEEEPEAGDRVEQALLPIPGQDQDPHPDCLQPDGWQDHHL